MQVLALGTSPQQVYQRALRQFTTEEIAEAFAVRQGRAMPAQLRQLLLAQAADLHAEFVRLLPSPHQPIRIQRWTARRIGLGLLMLALLVLAATNSRVLFDNKEAVQTPLNISSLGCTDLEPLWLQAQAVPSASLVPCVRYLPVGWSVADVAVNNGRSVITLNHDRAGAAALVVRLTVACNPTGAVETPAAEPSVRSYKRIVQLRGEYSTTWYDRFPGGCVTYRLDSRSDLQGRFASEVPLLFGFTSRQVLRQALHDRSEGRLQLDAGAAP
jgi:hypothetical protein